MDSRLLIIIFGISLSSCELSRLNEVAIAKCVHRICDHQGCCVKVLVKSNLHLGSSRFNIVVIEGLKVVIIG